MSRLAVLAALWTPMVVASCYRDRIVTRPVVVHAPSCLVRPAPLPPPGAEVCGAEWADYYIDLSTWVVEVSASCGSRVTSPAGGDP